MQTPVLDLARASHRFEANAVQIRRCMPSLSTLKMPLLMSEREITSIIMSMPIVVIIRNFTCSVLFMRLMITRATKVTQTGTKAQSNFNLQAPQLPFLGRKQFAHTVPPRVAGLPVYLP